MKTVHITVPASTANLGPGFDSLGLALAMRNSLVMESIDGGLIVEIEGQGAEDLPRDSANLMVQAAEVVFERVGRKPAGLRVHAVNRIPLRSGLGSSAAAVVGALWAADALVDGNLGRDEIFRLAHGLEGHPDNAAPALYGGFNLVLVDDRGVFARQVPIGPTQVAVAHPRFGLSTQAMRQALPDRVSMEDAVFNLSHALMTFEALRSGDYSLLSRVMADRLHEPYRAPHIPGFEQVTSAAHQAGAVAVALSGAGPSLVAFAPSGHDLIARRMADAWKRAGVEADGFSLAVDTRGVVEVDGDAGDAGNADNE